LITHCGEFLGWIVICAGSGSLVDAEGCDDAVRPNERTHRDIEGEELQMSRTRRLALTVAVVVGGTIAVGGVAFAADNEGDVTSDHGSIVNGHMTPGVNSSDSTGLLSDLGHVKF